MSTEARPVVLIVDDRSENLLALEAVLEPLQLCVERASSGEAALRRLLVDHAEDVTVIILDVQMPGMDGFETAHHIKARERTRHIPIIFLTAISTEMTHALRGYETGAVDYLAKPFNPDVLRAKVSVLVELHNHTRTIEAQRALLAQRLEERNRAQEALARQTIELERSNAELANFATLLSTELRQPLHSVAGFLDLLMAHHASRLGEDGALLITGAAEATNELFTKIDWLSAYAQVTSEGYEPESIDLDDVVAEVGAGMRGLFDTADIQLSSDPLPDVTGDGWQLRRLFTHLFQNAVEYHDSPGGEIHVGLSRQDGRWVVSVRDDGPGIPERFVPGLFTLLARDPDRGQPTPSPGSSTRGDEPRGTQRGVGLPIARQIVERHGGRIWIDSVVGQGTTVSFTLPDDHAPRPNGSEPR